MYDLYSVCTYTFYTIGLSILDVVECENDVSSLEDIFKSWFNDGSTDSEHLHLSLPPIPSADLERPLLLKCDLQERMLDPALLPGHVKNFVRSKTLLNVCTCTCSLAVYFREVSLFLCGKVISFFHPLLQVLQTGSNVALGHSSAPGTSSIPVHRLRALGKHVYTHSILHRYICNVASVSKQNSSIALYITCNVPLCVYRLSPQDWQYIHV